MKKKEVSVFDSLFRYTQIATGHNVSNGTNRKDGTRFRKFRLSILPHQAIKLSEIY